jgi:hypothetical protein
VEKRPREHSRNQIQISSENKERLSPATRKIKETKRTHTHTQQSVGASWCCWRLSAAARRRRHHLSANQKMRPPDAERRVCSLEKHKGWQIKAAPPANRVKVIRVEAHPPHPLVRRQMSERTPAAMLMKPCATAKLCNWRCKLDPE